MSFGVGPGRVLSRLDRCRTQAPAAFGAASAQPSDQCALEPLIIEKLEATLSALLASGTRPGGLILQGLGADMDYARLAALLSSKLCIKSLSLAGKNPEEAPSTPALAAQAGLHTLKFRCCGFPDGIEPLIQGLAANRSIVRMELVDCAIAGNAGNSEVQGELMKALRRNRVIRQFKTGCRDMARFQSEMAELRRQSPQLKVTRYAPFRGGNSGAPQS